MRSMRRARLNSVQDQVQQLVPFQSLSRRVFIPRWRGAASCPPCNGAEQAFRVAAAPGLEELASLISERRPHELEQGRGSDLPGAAKPNWRRGGNRKRLKCSSGIWERRSAPRVPRRVGRYTGAAQTLARDFRCFPTRTVLAYGALPDGSPSGL